MEFTYKVEKINNYCVFNMARNGVVAEQFIVYIDEQDKIFEEILFEYDGTIEEEYCSCMVEILYELFRNNDLNVQYNINNYSVFCNLAA